MQIPSVLLPVTAEPFPLRDGRVLSVPKATPAFVQWRGPALADTFGGKPILESGGVPCFAELIILRLFLAAGWSGRWVETYGAPAMRPRLLTTWSDEGLKAQTYEPILDEPVQALLDSIAHANGGTYSGCWDVVAWHERRLVFAESKRKGQDRLRATQQRWFAAAMAAGLSPESFLVVEWTIA